MNIDLIIPLYNSSLTVHELLSRIDAWAQKSVLNPKVIFVDDASTDHTTDVLKDCLNNVSFNCKVIKHARNYGQHSATATGFFYSSSPVVVTLDDDLQHNPSDIDKLYDCMVNEGADLVYASFSEKKHHKLRNAGTHLLQKILKAGGRDYSMVTSYRMMKKNVISLFTQKQDQTHFIDDFLLLAASKVVTCNIEHAERSSGKSGYSMSKLIKMASVILVLHSSVPLKMISRMGLLMSMVFFVLGCYYIYDKMFNDVSIGFTSLIVAIFFSTGLILFSLGIIGEYIRRIWISKQLLDRVIVAETWER